MRTISWLLAQRYLPFKKGDYSIRTMAFIAFMSIAVGAFSLALVTAVMNGFQVSVHQKMQSIHPEATIYSHNDPIAFDTLKKVVANEFPEVAALSPNALSHVMIQSDYLEEDEQPKVAILKSFDPNEEQRVSLLKNKLIKGLWPNEKQEKNYVIIGSSLADTLGADIGEKVTLLYLEPSGNKKHKVTVHQKPASITAIFETGIDEYDTGTIYTSFEHFREMFPDQGITQVGLSFTGNKEETIKALKQRTGLEVLTWQDLYLPLVSALILEKYAMFLILLLITLVASMNIIALLFMIITHKRADIAILKALGLSDKAIGRSFIYLGCTLGALATIVGLIGAIIASWILEHYPFIELPDVYYVSHLPAKMEWPIPVIVFTVIMIIVGIASWFSARRIRSIKIAQVLRFEG